MSIDRFYRKPTTPDEWRARAQIIQSRLEGLTIAELMRGTAKHGESADRDGYNPNQPRVPAGHSDGGQWTSKGVSGSRINDPRILSDATPDNNWIPGADYARSGHHYFPRASWKDLPLPEETRRVFEKAVSGPLAPKTWSKQKKKWLQHAYDEAHREYSVAVDQLFHNYIRRHHIRPRWMTPQQAERFIETIHNSSDLRIRRYNQMIKVLRQLYRGGRGND